MSILKSPLTILGILLIIAAGVLGLAPYFVNWNEHKAEFQRQASLLTGRTVTIDGQISVRLFPWPSLTADNVRISNPPGSLLQDFAQVERVEAEIAAPALLSGQIEFRKVRLLRPVLALERLASGGTSWNINPARSLKGLPGADQIAVAGIDIVDGQVFLGDGRRGGLSEVAGVNGRLSAPALDGPWRIQLDAAQAGTPFGLSASTGKYRPGKPLNIAVSIIPKDDTGFTWSFDGETLREDGNVTGKLTVAPAVLAGGKANPLNSLWQVRVTSELTADFDRVSLRKIEVVPATDLAGGNLVTGEADIALGQRLDVDARLAAASLDIDQLLGRNLLRSASAGTDAQAAGDSPVTGGTAALLDSLSIVLQALPAETRIRFETAITSMIIGGETLTRVRLAGQASPEALRITEASGGMPGQTRAGFTGVLLPAANAIKPQLAGDLSLESVSVRDLATWALPDSAEAINRVWSGARGRARLEAKLGLTPDTIRLTGIKARLDDATATGSFRVTTGDTPSVSVRMVADTINVDRYAPRGFSNAAIEDGTFTGLADLAAGLLAFGDAQMTIQTDSLVMRGVEARDIAVDVDMSKGAIELRTIEIGGIGDARLDIAGVLTFPANGMTGSVSGTFKATDPRPFLRLAGIIDAAGSRAPWARRLGPVDVRILSELTTAAAENSLKATLRGTAAGASIDASATFDGNLQDWRAGKLVLDATATGSTSANLLALTGLEPVKGGDEPASVELKLSGTPSSALSGTARVSAFAAEMDLDGGLTVNPQGRVAGTGRLGLSAEDASPLLAALGINMPAWPDGVARGLSLEADTVVSEGVIMLQPLKASLPANTASGTVKLSGTVREPQITADLELEHLDAGWLAGVLTSSPADPGQSAETFDLTRAGWLGQSLRIGADRLAIMPGLALANGTLAVERNGDGEFDIRLEGQTSAGKPFNLTTAATIDAPLVRVEGKLAAGLNAGDLLQTTNGQPAISGAVNLGIAFSGEGRSPAGLFSQLSGGGSLDAATVSIAGLNLGALTPRLEGLDTVENLDQLITSTLASGPFHARMDEMPLTLSTGILRSPAIAITANGGEGNMRMTADLAGPRTRIDVSLKPSGGGVPEGMPGLSMRLAGHPQAMQRSYDAGTLKTWVVTNVLQQGMDRLEELQREEQRLIEEERKFREEQERKEAERRQRIIEERQAAESARRRAAEELERLKSAADVRRREQEAEQKRLEELIQQNLPMDIPQDALVTPQTGSAGQPPAAAN